MRTNSTIGIHPKSTASILIEEVRSTYTTSDATFSAVGPYITSKFTLFNIEWSPPSFPLAFWGPIKNNKISSAFTPSIRPSSPPPDENRPPIAPIRRPRPDFSPSPTDSIGTDSPYSIPHSYSISTPRNFLFPDFESILYSFC